MFGIYLTALVALTASIFACAVLKIPDRCFTTINNFFLLYCKGWQQSYIAIDIGGYGKQSDGGTFKASDLYRSLTNRSLPIPEPSYFPNTTSKAPFVLLSDETYPLLPFLLKTFGGIRI